jgi:DNA-directed RNA polymerase specialized sigma24 family protein
VNAIAKPAAPIPVEARGALWCRMCGGQSSVLADPRKGVALEEHELRDFAPVACPECHGERFVVVDVRRGREVRACMAAVRAIKRAEFASEAMRLYALGWSVHEIGARLGFSGQAVHNWLRRNGVALRKSGCVLGKPSRGEARKRWREMRP